MVPRGEASNHTRQRSVIVPPLGQFNIPPPPLVPFTTPPPHGQLTAPMQELRRFVNVTMPPPPQLIEPTRATRATRPTRPTRRIRPSTVRPTQGASTGTRSRSPMSPMPSIQILEALMIGDGTGPKTNGTEHIMIRKYFSDNKWFCAWCAVDYCSGREHEYCEFVYAHESVSVETAHELHAVNKCSVCSVGLMSQYKRNNCPACRCIKCIVSGSFCDDCDKMLLGHEGKTYLVRVAAIDA